MYEHGFDDKTGLNGLELRLCAAKLPLRELEAGWGEVTSSYDDGQVTGRELDKHIQEVEPFIVDARWPTAGLTEDEKRA